ncbi:helix-turn-helix transcriptional regulator [Kineococcus radiotolerans]|uniref:Transcriptional regulator, XRE family n=1 Tax=Kineococcus radiotolerans (strain ATCC BAA-149 / DSM 14245 / SRS30216) TaxID=266940 RepID=A6W9E6_KINRD|nr:helix-turn-helix transcriptional regulator [Kineococcus radiotolerans]ABS03435.1 transcriptional regulator, XRE family [Kineococcus radiotolerans SRS30216 = ATCC BAA-149]
MAKQSELGSFLRARRAATSPDDVGLRSLGPRRVPGLRRDEVAQLAGVSVDYYTRLEQGRETHPSAQVLDALAHVLGMSPEERRHTYSLAQLAWTPPLPSARAPMDASLVGLMNTWPDAACFVLDPVLDILEMNPLARRLFTPFRSTENLVAMVFLDPAGPRFYTDWQRAASSCVANLHATADVHVGASRREELIRTLRAGSDAFAQLWSAHDVKPKTHDSKELFHPAVGAITVQFDALEVSAMPGHQLVVYRAEPASVSGRRLRALAEADPASLSAASSSWTSDRAVSTPSTDPASSRVVLGAAGEQ